MSFSQTISQITISHVTASHPMNNSEIKLLCNKHFNDISGGELHYGSDCISCTLMDPALYSQKSLNLD